MLDFETSKSNSEVPTSNLWKILENYIISEGAVSHSILYYQHPSIACCQVMFYANNYFEQLPIVSTAFNYCIIIGKVFYAQSSCSKNIIFFAFYVDWQTQGRRIICCKAPSVILRMSLLISSYKIFCGWMLNPFLNWSSNSLHNICHVICICCHV